MDNVVTILSDFSETTFSSSVLSLTQSDQHLCEAMLADVEMLRLVATHHLKQHRKKQLGQFLTPLPVAKLMVKMFQKLDLPHIHLLDAGAGTGCLSAAFVANVCRQKQRPLVLEVTAYEIDPTLIKYLRKTQELCNRECKANGITFKYHIHEADFIREACQPSTAWSF